MAEEAPTLDTETVRELCGDYAAFTRTNLSEEHGQVARRRRSVDSNCECLDRDPAGGHRGADINLLRDVVRYTEK